MPKFLATAGIALLVSLVLGSAPAIAHAALVSTDPSDGVRLDTAPTKVTLEFSENVASPAYLVITGPDGSRVKTGKTEVLDRTVTATVAPVDLKGTYSMSYRVVSADSHPVEGTTKFEITTGWTVKQVSPAEEESFVHRHTGHLLWGLLGAVIAVGLLLWPLRSKSE
ncbi:MAG: copper resistance protein CopC [Actinomycetota bacterium]|nr:copper resistance protein CopC [Actinomycetota bacterium]